MRILSLTLFIIVLVSATACYEDVIKDPPPEAVLFGNWSNTSYNDSLIASTRVAELPDDEYGFSFLEDGVYIEHKNAGWCGTPPVTYASDTGSWSLIDSVIFIEVGYWGGNTFSEWKIKSISETTLEVIELNFEYTQNFPAYQ
jgi:hypothetical protein